MTLKGKGMKLSIKVDFGNGQKLGTGKVALLKHISTTGSISGAGRAMDMSYRRAWLLVEEMNAMFRNPLVVSQSGGKQGGGATVTEQGKSVISIYDTILNHAAKSAAGQLKRLTAMQVSHKAKKTRPLRQS
jgi:molybdate transport system regulatory protein